jgi:hypothetical protein
MVGLAYLACGQVCCTPGTGRLSDLPGKPHPFEMSSADITFQRPGGPPATHTLHMPAVKPPALIIAVVKLRARIPVEEDSSLERDESVVFWFGCATCTSAGGIRIEVEGMTSRNQQVIYLRLTWQEMFN